MSDNSGYHAGVRHFSGKGADASKDYLAWKRWSKAFLQVQRSKGVSEEAFGSLLFTCISEPALQELEDVEPEDLVASGGEQLIYDRLDRRYPEREAQDKIGEALQAVFQLQAIAKERTEDFVGRAQTAFSKAQREGIILPPEARGYLLLHGAIPGQRELQRRDRAIVLAASRRSWKEVEFATALRLSFPENLPSATSGVAVTGVEATLEHTTDDEELRVQAEVDTLLADLGENANGTAR
jgi:hypothetical protein